MSAPEGSGFDDDEWAEAKSECLQSLVDNEWSTEDAEKMVDDWLIAEMCEVNRRSRSGDDARARRKESRHG